LLDFLSFYVPNKTPKFEIKMNDNSTNIYEMEDFIERFKELIWVVITAIGSLLLPIREILILLSLGFVFNIITGIIADVHVNRQQFSIKKAFSAISQAAFFMACVFFLDYGSKLLHDAQIGQTSVRWLTLIVSYFYLVNIFRNAKLIFPKNLAISFIYELLSTEIFLRLKEMVGIKTKKE